MTLVDPLGAEADLRGAPNGPVTLHFSLVVTDALGAVSTADSVDIAVDANGAPTANAGPDQSGIRPHRS